MESGRGYHPIYEFWSCRKRCRNVDMSCVNLGNIALIVWKIYTLNLLGGGVEPTIKKFSNHSFRLMGPILRNPRTLWLLSDNLHLHLAEPLSYVFCALTYQGGMGVKELLEERSYKLSYGCGQTLVRVYCRELSINCSFRLRDYCKRYLIYSTGP